jgi:hypothetical protein
MGVGCDHKVYIGIDPFVITSIVRAINHKLPLLGYPYVIPWLFPWLYPGASPGSMVTEYTWLYITVYDH